MIFSTFSKPCGAVNSSILLVAIVGVCNVHIFSAGLVGYISFAGLVLSIVLSILVSGRIVAQLRGKNAGTAMTILKENWVNYVIVLIILAVPVFLLRQLTELMTLGFSQYFLLFDWPKMIIGMVTIYVLPIVFLKKEATVAIFAGIAYFFTNAKASLAIAGLVILSFTINFLGVLTFMMMTQGSWRLILTFGLSLIITYLFFVAFAAATHVLIQGDQVTASNDLA